MLDTYFDEYIPLMEEYNCSSLLRCHYELSCDLPLSYYAEEYICLSSPSTDHPSPFGAAPLGERATASQYGYY